MLPSRDAAADLARNQSLPDISRRSPYYWNLGNTRRNIDSSSAKIMYLLNNILIINNNE